MREDTGRPDITLQKVFIDASSREYFISIDKAKQIIEAGAVEIEKILRETMDYQEQQLAKLKEIEAHLSEVTGTEYLTGGTEDA